MSSRTDLDDGSRTKIVALAIGGGAYLAGRVVAFSAKWANVACLPYHFSASKLIFLQHHILLICTIVRLETG